MQICPVGALTAKPYRFKARPWDLEQVESTCTTCSVGCRITVQSSDDQLLRYQGVDSDPVNWGWLCDKGRFGFEAVNCHDRLRSPLVRQGDSSSTASWAQSARGRRSGHPAALDVGGPVVGRASSAARAAPTRTPTPGPGWPREVIGTANVDAQLGDGLPAEVLWLPRATIDEACAATTVVLLGPDLKEELPVLYLRVRDAAEKRRSASSSSRRRTAA